MAPPSTTRDHHYRHTGHDTQLTPIPPCPISQTPAYLATRSTLSVLVLRCCLLGTWAVPGHGPNLPRGHAGHIIPPGYSQKHPETVVSGPDDAIFGWLFVYP